MQFPILHSFPIPKIAKTTQVYIISISNPPTTQQQKIPTFFPLQIDNSWYRRGFFSNNTPKPISPEHIRLYPLVGQQMSTIFTKISKTKYCQLFKKLV
jgi:hypothetical protein